MVYHLQLIYLHWWTKNKMKNLIKFSLALSFVFCQTNPVDIATSGANKLRMHGQLNVFHNPATLGYKAAQLESEATVNNLPLEESGEFVNEFKDINIPDSCLLYTSPSPRDRQKSRMPSSA